MVFINNHTTIPPLETAGHETYHARKGTSAREAYTDILRDHLNYASPAFREYQQIIADAYFEGDIDLEDGAQLQKFEEELFAYISGHLSDGSHEKMLRPMLRDYDAIRAAWERFRKDGADGLGAADAANSVGAAAAGFTGDTERGFSRNVATDQNMDPEIRESFQEDPEMDFRLGNQKTLAKAQAIFNAGFEGARSTLEQAIGQAQAGRKLPPEMVPLSRMVANQLARNGDVYGARKILSDISVELTEAGQLGQAAAILPGTGCRRTFLRDSDAPRRSHLDSCRLRHHLYSGSHYGISGPPHKPPRLRKHLWHAVWKHGKPYGIELCQ